MVILMRRNSREMHGAEENPKHFSTAENKRTNDSKSGCRKQLQAIAKFFLKKKLSSGFKINMKFVGVD